ncbi:hypothetical protein KMP13_17510 [Epibacterium ulvae]|uniref:hypothetical protein n=1 Tax=Epibacterium ulvae TaxID=1156985 RepID=UPI001BFBFF3E|nr:hypothetical protein [Epibacterium ulvae]MBT8155628.1 hypothetical protein [Epibacterium ulvae]
MRHIPMMNALRAVVTATAVMPLTFGASSAWAGENETLNMPSPAPLSLELNAADNFGESCRLSFLLRNETASEITSFVAETVLFSDQGQVALLTLFDFGLLPKGRPRVRQFQVPDISCDRLSMVLINGADTCTGGAHTAQSCAAALSLTSRVKIQLEG